MSARENAQTFLMHNIYLVDSPFQLLCAIEAALQSCNDNALFILKGVNSQNDEQIRRLAVEKGCFNYITDLSVASTRRKSEWEFFRHCFAMWKKGRTIKNFYIGEYRAWKLYRCAQLLRPENIVFLDDGNVTLKISELCSRRFMPRLQSMLVLNSWRSGLLDSLTALGMGVLSIGAGTKTGFYSCFDILPSRLFSFQGKNNFSSLANFDRGCEVEQKSVCFIGCALSESALLDSVQENAFLRAINKHYVGFSISYVPHRRDSEEKIAYISDVLGWRITRPGKPIEFMFAESKALPVQIASFYSTALFTVSTMLPQLRYTCFKPALDVFPVRFRSEISSVYDLYRRHMQIVELE